MFTLSFRHNGSTLHSRVDGGLLLSNVPLLILFTTWLLELFIEYYRFSYTRKIITIPLNEISSSTEHFLLTRGYLLKGENEFKNIADLIETFSSQENSGIKYSKKGGSATNLKLKTPLSRYGQVSHSVCLILFISLSYSPYYIFIFPLQIPSLKDMCANYLRNNFISIADLPVPHKLKLYIKNYNNLPKPCLGLHKNREKCIEQG